MKRPFSAALLAIALPVAAFAQLGVLPPVAPALDPILQLPGRLTNRVDAMVGNATQLATDRVARIRSLVRANPDRISLDAQGQPARSGEVIIDNPNDAIIAAASERGYHLIERVSIDELGISYARLSTPPGRSLKSALKDLQTVAGSRAVTADQLFFQSGTLSDQSGGTAVSSGARDGTVGMIDGGVAANAGIRAQIVRRGFATGAPGVSPHGTAVASLLGGASTITAAAKDRTIMAADVYGTDPAGGGALAIAQALGWMVRERVPVVSVSLVGPDNALLAKAVAAAIAHGTMIVAAVGNDGPAAPPSYPASYSRVIAITGVDGRNRALIEAGRALHLDYAAPGADMLALNPSGKAVTVRGTSFATPLAAAALVAAYPRPDADRMASAVRQVDASARRLAPSNRYGRGLICETCRTPSK